MNAKDMTDSQVMVASTKILLDQLTNEERMALFAEYCHGCGIEDTNCQCWNDE